MDDCELSVAWNPIPLINPEDIQKDRQLRAAVITFMLLDDKAISIGLRWKGSLRNGMESFTKRRSNKPMRTMSGYNIVCNSCT